MSNTFLAFAESPLSSSDYDHDDFLVKPEEYDQAFPPLRITKDNPIGDEWEEINCDDDTFSCNSAVWIGCRSYAEIATNAGVQHEPVTFSEYTWSAFRQNDISSTPPPRNGRRNGAEKENEDDTYNPWYQSKFTGGRKHEISQNISSRKKKSFQMTYRRIAHSHIIAWKQNIQPMEHELTKAREYLQEINSIQDRLPKYVCPRSWFWDPRVKKIITTRFEELADSCPRIRKVVPKNYYTSETCYLEAIYRESYRWPFWSVQYDYGNNIIPKLEEDYKKARERCLRAFVEALPLPKDKSLSSMSRKKYVRAVLLQE